MLSQSSNTRGMGEGMSQLAEMGVDALRSTVMGPVLLPGDEGYDDARRLWNAAIDKHPGVIARCRSAADVSRSVLFARDNELEIAVRGGAHNPGGASGVDD